MSSRLLRWLRSQNKVRAVESCGPRGVAFSTCPARKLTILHRVWATVILLAAHTSLLSQTPQPPAKPYASIDPDAISYAGPGREKSYDLRGSEVRIGLILPLSGPRRLEGEALLAAARLAIEDKASFMTGGVPLTLSPRDENGLWGRGASEIVKLVVEDRVVAFITSPDGRVAHLSEQVGNRLSVPVITLASDDTTTQINIPWLFRIVPDDRMQAQVFAENIFGRHKFARVTVVFENDHDGKVGRDAFLKAAQNFHATTPAVVEIPATFPRIGSIAAQIKDQNVQAVVMWTTAENATSLISALQPLDPRAEFYVCHKAIHGPLLTWAQNHPATRISGVGTSGHQTLELRKTFDRRFRAQLNATPSPAARAMYDAVRTIAFAIRVAGPNRGRIRDALASLREFEGASGLISFDGAGNNQLEVSLIPLK